MTLGKMKSSYLIISRIKLGITAPNMPLYLMNFL